MSSSTFSSSFTCKCAGATPLCFCELTSPLFAPSPSSSNSTPQKKCSRPKVKSSRFRANIIPGCFCFRCDMLRDEDDLDDDEEENYYENEILEEIEIEDDDLISSILVVEDVVEDVFEGESVKSSCIVTSLC